MAPRTSKTTATPPRSRVAGVVLEPSGEPVREAQVFVAGGPSHPDIAAITGENGRFSLGGLLAGRYRLRADADGFDPTTIEIAVAPGRRLELEIELVRRNGSNGGGSPPNDWESPEIPGNDEW